RVRYYGRRHRYRGGDPAPAARRDGEPDHVPGLPPGEHGEGRRRDHRAPRGPGGGAGDPRTAALPRRLLRRPAPPADARGGDGAGVSQEPEDDPIAKSYDSRLLRRLLTYLRPYKAQVAISFLLIVVMAGLDLVPPYL